MLDQAFHGITYEHWIEEVNGWTYADVVYHTIITQEFYIRDTPEDMQWGTLYGDKDQKETNPRQYFPDKQTLQDYNDTVKEKIETYLKSITDKDLYTSDGFEGHLDSVHKKLVYLLRHNAHHLGELTLMNRTLELERIKWI